MHKTTDLSSKIKGVLPIAAGFLLTPSFFFAQTEEQVRVIREKSNLKSLSVLKNRSKANALSVSQLRSMSDQKKIPFSGNIDGRYYQLVGFDNTGKALYYTTFNSGAAQGTQTDKLHAEAGIFNLEGENMTIHEWDGGGVLVSHQEFGGRATQKDEPTALSDHATHVGGTLIASGEYSGAKGMAPRARLDAYDWNNDTIEAIEAAEQGALVSNHSYGYSGGFVWSNASGRVGWHWLGDDEDTEYKFYGKYRGVDRIWDVITLYAPYYLPVKAAGNPRGDGPEAGESHYVRVYDEESDSWVWVMSFKERQKNGGEFGFDSINHGSLGKNILTVGAAHKIANGYSSPSDVRMASFSGFGPTDDGRIKPDIAGIGVGIVSPVTTDDSSYESMNGTSMASPNVTGSLLLLQEHYRNLNNGNFMKSATLKALAIGTANEAGEHDGPDYASGWGLLNAYRAATVISTTNQYSSIEERTLANNGKETISVVASGTEPLVATIAWTDPTPAVMANDDILNDRTRNLVNDLDIRIFDANGVEHFPWKLDPENPNNPATKGDNIVDNVEQVVIKNPVKGQTYRIEVSHKGRLQQNTLNPAVGGSIFDLENAESQDFSIVITGINKGVENDLALNSVSIEATPAQYSTATPVKFEIENKGNRPAKGAELHYKLIDTDNNTEVSSGVLPLNEIPAEATITKTINIDLSKSFVNYKIEGNIVFSDDAVAVNNKYFTTAYGILTDLVPTDAEFDFSFEKDFAQNGWSVENADGDSRTWMKYDDSELARTGNSLAVNFPNWGRGSDDWLFSSPMKVKGGTPYRVTLYTRKFQDLDEKLYLHWGDQQNSGAMVNAISPEILATTDYVRHSYEFVVPNDQVIYLGIQNKTNADVSSYAVAVDDFHLQHAQGKPEVDFFADRQVANTFEPVLFTPDLVKTESSLPTTGYEWTFTPSTITFAEGTSATDENPKVIFNEEGLYTVELKATNATGTSSLTKTEYIETKNTPVKASFSNGNILIYEGASISFNNTSTGDPMPKSFDWSITPSEGVEFINGTDASSQNPEVQFNQEGVYSVSLTATSQFSSDSTTKENIIEVRSLHGAVRNLTGNYNNTTKSAELRWERPVLNPQFFENFDDSTIGFIDYDNGDNSRWEVLPYQGENRTSGIVSRASVLPSAIKGITLFGNIDVDDWLVSSKLSAGAEVLKFLVKNLRPERYDIYIVPESADANNEFPTLEEVKAGHKVESYDPSPRTAGSNFEQKVLDISQYTQNGNFHIAFHHRTQKDDRGNMLILDNIEVGYVNELNQTQPDDTPVVNSRPEEEITIAEAMQKGDKIITANINDGIALSTLSNNTDIKTSGGRLGFPTLVGYEVVKNGVSTVFTTDDINNKAFDDFLNKTYGQFVYDVYALYSDGIKSEKRTVVLDKLDYYYMVYPNPSTDGRFFAEVRDESITSLKADVYDMSGKLIYQKESQGNIIEILLKNAKAGVYILHLTDNKGGIPKVSKLIVR